MCFVILVLFLSVNNFEGLPWIVHGEVLGKAWDLGKLRRVKNLPTSISVNPFVCLLISL